MTDLIDIAGQFSVQHGGPVVRVSHWQMGDDGCFSRSHDTHEGLGGTPDIWLVPGRLTGVIGAAPQF